MARPGLSTHRKFRRLARALGSPILARGALELMWESAYECGDDYVGTSDDLEAQVGWGGEPGRLARALADAGAPEGHGFIEPITADLDKIDAITRYRIHDLWHHAPDYVAKRRKRELERLQRVAPSAKRRRTAPVGSQRPPSRDSQTGHARTPSPSHAPSPSPAPSPAHSGANGTARLAFGGKVLEVPKFLDEEFVKRLNGQAFDLTGFYIALDTLLAQTGKPWDLRWIRDQFAAEAPSPDRRRIEREERPFTAEERAKAERHRRSVWGGCRHDPRCANGAACIAAIILGWRKQEAEAAAS